MTEKIPTVSIGLPVYNGAQFLEQAIDFILAQTYTDFELIISDNASTDRTDEICNAYQVTDFRVRYHRNETNIGGANNENLTFRMAQGKYFHYAAHDDICAPQLLEKCVNVLENDPSVVLAYGQTIDIDENGRTLGQKSLRLGEFDLPHQRFLEIADRKHQCEVIYGLIRSDILSTTRLELNYTDSDRTLLCELGLHGKFQLIAEPLFYKRYHSKNMYYEWRTRMAWFDEKLVGKIVLPNWIQFFDFFTTIHRVDLPKREKLLCYLTVLGPILWKNGREMLRDLKFVVVMLSHSKAWREERYAKTKGW